MSENKITISEERHDQLLRSEHRLSALASYGVDNWEGSFDAWDEYSKAHKDDPEFNRLFPEDDE